MAGGKQTTTFVVDSSMRDKSRFPSPNQYTFYFPFALNNVSRVELASAEVPNTELSVEPGSTDFYLVEHAVPPEATATDSSPEQLLRQADEFTHWYRCSIPPRNYGLVSLVGEVVKTLNDQSDSENQRHFSYNEQVVPDGGVASVTLRATDGALPFDARKSWFALVFGGKGPTYRFELEGEFVHEPLQLSSGNVHSDEQRMTFRGAGDAEDVAQQLAGMMAQLDPAFQDVSWSVTSVGRTTRIDFSLGPMNLTGAPLLGISTGSWEVRRAVRVSLLKDGMLATQLGPKLGFSGVVHLSKPSPATDQVGLIQNDSLPRVTRPNFVYLCEPDLTTMHLMEPDRFKRFGIFEPYRRTPPPSNIFARILLPVGAGDMVFLNNDYITSVKEFATPLASLKELNFSFRNAYGQLFDFKGVDHTLSLRVIHGGDA